MQEKKKIGIYGGTFNPPHIAHVRACEAFYNTVKPAEMLIIPDFLPPHKEVEGAISAEDRLQMTRIAFENLCGAKVSDMEIRRGGRSYTAITLSELKTDDNELYFLCGTDMFLSLDHWYRPDLIFSLATICYVRRENEIQNDSKLVEITEYYKKKYTAKIIPIVAEVTELSSTELRAKIKSGEDVTEFLPQNVNDYIQKRALYK